MPGENLNKEKLLGKVAYQSKSSKELKSKSSKFQ